MTPSKAILAGSGAIAAAILVAAVLFQPGSDAKDQAAAAAPRFQIVRADETRSWRLDTATGQITLCRLAGDTLICAESAQATRFPKKSPEQVIADRAAERQRADDERRRAEAAAERRHKEKIAERNFIFDRFMALFDRVLRFAEKHPERVQAPAIRPDETAQAL